MLAITVDFSSNLIAKAKIACKNAPIRLIFGQHSDIL